MATSTEILEQHIHEQIALEEQLCRILRMQAEGISSPEFADAKALLLHAADALEEQYRPLNELLDSLEKESEGASAQIIANNGHGIRNFLDLEKQKCVLSRLLRDDYSALNHITISNTSLHTAALALNSDAVATLALKHLEALAPLVIKIGKLVPQVILRELQSLLPTVDLAVAEQATQNTRAAWRRAA
jgi:hypothetical protein